jgi:hypothetical protein
VLGRAVDLGDQQVAGIDAEIVVGVIDDLRAWRVEIIDIIGCLVAFGG